jgi:hypothetical protein
MVWYVWWYDSRSGWDARPTAVGDPTMYQGKDVEVTLSTHDHLDSLFIVAMAWLGLGWLGKTLTHELRLMKQKCSHLELENQSLRTQVKPTISMNPSS